MDYDCIRYDWKRSLYRYCRQQLYQVYFAGFATTAVKLEIQMKGEKTLNRLDEITKILSSIHKHIWYEHIGRAI